VAATIAIAVFPGCRRNTGATADADAPIGVTVQTVRMETLRDVAAASGTIVPSTAADLTIYAPEAARIVELPKHENDTVAIGDVLVRFEIPSVMQELAARELAVGEAQARAERARANFARLSDLYAGGLAARTAYENARADQQSTDSILAEATNQLEITKIEAGRGVVRAHFPGRVVRVFHVEGDPVSGDQTDPVIRIVDPTRVQVSVQLPVAQLARIVPGQSATVRAFDVAEPFAAMVATKPATTDPNAPTGEVRLTFDRPSTLALDAPVSVEILLEQRPNVMVVPTDAVVRDNDAVFVVVAGDDQRAHRRDVRTGIATRIITEIAAGLAPGERVIVGGLGDVTEGARISFSR
jgi:membrane fusion protein (multidrug efflux system)